MVADVSPVGLVHAETFHLEPARPGAGRRRLSGTRPTRSSRGKISGDDLYAAERELQRVLYGLLTTVSLTVRQVPPLRLSSASNSSCLFEARSFTAKVARTPLPKWASIHGRKVHLGENIAIMKEERLAVLEEPRRLFQPAPGLQRKKFPWRFPL